MRNIFLLHNIRYDLDFRPYIEVVNGLEWELLHVSDVEAAAVKYAEQ